MPEVSKAPEDENVPGGEGEADDGSVRAMRRIGTSGNYLRITRGNEHLLRDRRMVEVTLVKDADGNMTEEESTAGDSLASRDLGRLVSDVRRTSDRLDSLVKHVARLPGGRDALEKLDIDVPEQTMHEGPAGKEGKRREALSAKKRDRMSKNRQRREEVRATVKAQEKAGLDKGRKVKGVATADLVDGHERDGDDPGKPDTDAPATAADSNVVPADLVDGSERTPAEEDPGAAKPTEPGEGAEKAPVRAAGDENVAPPAVPADMVDGTERLGDDPGNPHDGDKASGETDTTNEDI